MNNALDPFHQNFLVNNTLDVTSILTGSVPDNKICGVLTLSPDIPVDLLFLPVAGFRV